MHIKIASLGRCGSSMLFQAVKQANKGKTGKFHLYPQEITEISKKKDKEIDKVVFIFGNPYNIIFSLLDIYHRDRKHQGSNLKGGKFIREHAKGVSRDADEIKKLKPENIINRVTKKDLLALEKMFDAFQNPPKDRNWELCNIRYETLWDYKTDLEDFLDFKISLPEKKARETKYGSIKEETKKEVYSTYTDFKKKVDEAPDFEIK